MMKLRTRDYVIDWDDIKARLNVSKHGVSFETAARALDDTRALDFYDRLHSDSEDRWITIGRISDGRIVTVVHAHMESTRHPEIVRLISARPATLRECVLYESGGYMIRDAEDDDLEIPEITDITGAVRGRFYRGERAWQIPVYLDRKILDYFIDAAHQRGMEARDLLNEILAKEIERREACEASGAGAA